MELFVEETIVNRLRFSLLWMKLKTDHNEIL